MENAASTKTIRLAACVGLAMLLFSGSAKALDAAYSRKGGFTGFGLGAGAALFLDEQVAGDMDLNLQVGMGASDTLTVALNLDSRLIIHKDFLVGMIVPGPEFSFFLFKGLYIHAGAGLAFVIPEETDFTIGMDVGAGIGYEKFINTNLAGYIRMDVDYFFISDLPDIISVGFWFGLRYY